MNASWPSASSGADAKAVNSHEGEPANSSEGNTPVASFRKLNRLTTLWAYSSWLKSYLGAPFIESMCFPCKISVKVRSSATSKRGCAPNLRVTAPVRFSITAAQITGSLFPQEASMIRSSYRLCVRNSPTISASGGICPMTSSGMTGGVSLPVRIWFAAHRSAISLIPCTRASSRLLPAQDPLVK